ncbi:MAG: 2-amino-4-hydroxy-6-hydroxymethyldihydropteridine diphosphokinase [Paludibacter sp.]|nr:2-amino-4-hydroxy-6-hydroxymethyldihydropteridine diphosphokinase [Paludibacter sp.]
MAITFFSIGTNLGNRKRNIERAIALLEKRVGRCVKISDFYQTSPWGFVSENEFLNIAAEFETTLQPLDLLKVTQQIERALGRARKSENGTYCDRIIDIDILFYDNLIINLPQLTLPHPLLQKRDFVLTPLAQIASEWQHPILKKTISEIKKAGFFQHDNFN